MHFKFIMTFEANQHICTFSSESVYYFRRNLREALSCSLRRVLLVKCLHLEKYKEDATVSPTLANSVTYIYFKTRFTVST